MTNLKELERMMFAAAERVEQRHLDRMKAMGAAPGILAMGETIPAIGVASGVGEASGMFLPGDGPAHIVQPVLDDGALVDLVYWRTLQPGRWWLLRGNGWAINPDDLIYHGWGPQSPHLLDTPLDWLRAGCRGSVVLDWSAQEVRHLMDHDAIGCASDRVARALNKALRGFVRFPAIRTEALAYAA